MWYPKECFSINENATRRNRKAYEDWYNKVYAECIRRNPNYDKLSLRERYAIRCEVVKDFPSPV